MAMSNNASGLIGTLSFMGSPATAMRSTAQVGSMSSGSAFGGAHDFGRDAHPLAAQAPAPAAQFGAQFGQQLQAGQFTDGSTSNSSANLFMNDGNNTVPQHTMQETHTGGHIWGDPHFVIHKILDEKGAIRNDLHLTDAQQEQLDAGKTVTITDASGTHTYHLETVQINQHGTPGEVYHLFSGDNLAVSALYVTNKNNPDGPTVIGATQVTTNAGFQVLYSQADTFIKVNMNDGNGWQKITIPGGDQPLELPDGTQVYGVTDGKGKGVAIESNLGNVVYVSGGGAQQVTLSGVAASDDLGRSKADQNMHVANNVAEAPGWRDANHGLLGVMSSSNKKFNEDFGETFAIKKNDPGSLTRLLIDTKQVTGPVK